MIDKSEAWKNSVTTYLPNEIQVLSKLSHPNIIKVFNIVETDSHCFLSLELAENGSLLDYINLKPAMPEQEARFLFNQLCQAVDYCHSRDIVHRDIKCDNVLLDKFMNLKLGGMTNFGEQRSERDTIRSSAIENRALVAKYALQTRAYKYLLLQKHGFSDIQVSFR